MVSLGAGPVRRIWNEETGWVFVVLALTSSGLLAFAQEARMYTFAALFVTGAALFGHLALRDGRRSDLVAFAVFTWAASLTHYFALVAVGINALVLLTTAFVLARQRVRPLAVSAAFPVFGFMPWAPFFWGQLATVTKGFWIPPTSLDLVPDGTPFDPLAGGVYDSRWVETAKGLDAIEGTTRLWLVDGTPGPSPVDANPLLKGTGWTKQGEDLTLEEPMSWAQLKVRRFRR